MPAVGGTAAERPLDDAPTSAFTHELAKLGRHEGAAGAGSRADQFAKTG
jgi:hypothetical protein